MKVDGFDWDDGNWPKCGRHGVSRGEIETLFEGVPQVYADPDHSLAEQRLRAIGRLASGRFLYVVRPEKAVEALRCRDSHRL